MSDKHYSEKELIEKNYFDKFSKTQPLIKWCEYTKLKEVYDCKMISGSTKIIGEIKVRETYPIYYFQKEGAFLELKKIESMQRQKKILEEEKNIKLKMFYFCFCADGVLAYELREPHHYNFRWEYLPTNSENPSVKEWKLIHPLKNPNQVIYGNA